MPQTIQHLSTPQAIASLVLLLASLSTASCRSWRQKNQCLLNWEATTSNPCYSNGSISQECMGRYNNFLQCFSNTCKTGTYQDQIGLKCAVASCTSYGDDINKYNQKGLNCFDADDQQHQTEKNEILNCINQNPLPVCLNSYSASKCQSEEAKADTFSKNCDQKYIDQEYYDCIFSCTYPTIKDFLQYNANCWKKDVNWNTSFSDTSNSSSDQIHFSMKLLGVLLAVVITVY